MNFQVNFGQLFVLYNCIIKALPNGLNHTNHFAEQIFDQLPILTFHIFGMFSIGYDGSKRTVLPQLTSYSRYPTFRWLSIYI